MVSYLLLALPATLTFAISTRSPRSSLPIIRNSSNLLLDEKPWTASGGNVYWLGLDENVIPPVTSPPQPFYAPYNASYPTKGRITEAMDILKVMGARTLRSQTLGISVGNPLSVMPTLGQVNEQAFESIDWAVSEAGRVGLRIFAPLEEKNRNEKSSLKLRLGIDVVQTDNYDYYHGGKFVFLRWRGINITNSGIIDTRVQEFYTNRTVINDFKNYIKIILTHRNQFTNLTYAEDPTMFAYETGNELGGPTFGDKSVPVAWTEEITSYIKELAPNKLTIDGTYGINEDHLSIKSVDIFSDHFYPLDIDKLSQGVEAVAKAGKVYFAAEYGWTPQTQTKTKSQEFFAWIEARQNSSSPVVLGDHFWSLFGHNVPDCSTFVDHNDGLALQYGNPKNPANYTTEISRIRKHLFKMQGQTVDALLPPAPCPGT